MIHAILPVGMLQCNCSVLGDESSREAIVVDPGDNIDQVLLILAQHELRVKAIVITHAHIDHIGGAQKLKAATGAPVYMNEDDAPLYDSLGGDSRKILRSIHEKLMTLPEDAVVIPGHGQSTTIGREKRFNPFLR